MSGEELRERVRRAYMKDRQPVYHECQACGTRHDTHRLRVQEEQGLGAPALLASISVLARCVHCMRRLGQALRWSLDPQMAVGCAWTQMKVVEAIAIDPGPW